MDYPRFIGRIQARAALETPEGAQLVLANTLMAIGRSLDHAIALRVAALLPAPLRESVLRGVDGGEPDLARDHLTIVCEVLATEIDDRSLTALRQLLPEGIARFLVRSRIPLAPPTCPPHGAHIRLAAGRTTIEPPLRLPSACGPRWIHGGR